MTHKAIARCDLCARLGPIQSTSPFQKIYICKELGPERQKVHVAQIGPALCFFESFRLELRGGSILGGFAPGI